MMVVPNIAGATIRCSSKHITARGFPSTIHRKLHQSPLSASHLISKNDDECSLYCSNVAPSRYLSYKAGAGRSRKRPRAWKTNGPALSSDSAPSSNQSTNSIREDLQSTNPATIISESSSDSSSLPYPKGKPWRVLWPRPHGIPNEPKSSIWDFHKRIPTREQIQKGWILYKETWEDGITGIPTKRKETATTATTGGQDSNSESSSPILTRDQLHEIGDNATNNKKIVRQDAQELLEHAKDTTGIRTQDDLKALASEAMKVATECIREFMAGYRSGRDSEIDKMLHEYFQDDKDENETKNGVEEKESSPPGTHLTDEDAIHKSQVTTKTGRKKKRKPKRGIPRI